MSIQLLPAEVVAQIKSSAIITSLNGVVYGLIQNSLDASATKINVSIDYSRGNCTVEDNGLGIAPRSFDVEGGLGRLYYTSKYPPQPNVHGKYGEFLSSLAALSLLSIASHHHEHRSHNALTIHNSRIVSRNVPAIPEQRVLTFPSGTRVTVRDLFGSMPVRVKQRAAEAERLGTAKNLDQLILHSVALILAWPGEVTLSIRDVSTQRVVVLNTSDGIGETPGSRNAARGVLSRVPRILSQAALAEKLSTKSWVTIGASAPRISVSGCVCLKPVATKRNQFISLGVHPLMNDHQTNVLYEVFNGVFANSYFGVVDQIGFDDEGIPLKMDGFTRKELKVKRGVDRWPMFCLRIDLQGDMISMGPDEWLDERHHDMAIITDILQVVAYEFLKKHHFGPKAVNAFGKVQSSGTSSSLRNSPDRAIASSSGSGSQSRQSSKNSKPSPDTRKKAKTTGNSADRPASPFSTWSRLKRSVPNGSASSKSVGSSPSSPKLPESRGSVASQPQAPEVVPWAHNPLVDRSGKIIRKPFEDVDEEPVYGSTPTPRLRTPGKLFGSSTDADEADTKGNFVWINPATKVKTLVDSRTGFMVKASPGVGDNGGSVASKKPRLEGIKNSTVLGSASAKDEPDWLKKVKANFKNPEFDAAETAIRRLPDVPEVVEWAQIKERHSCRHHDAGAERVTLDPAGQGNAMIAGKIQISREALQKADVIGQVDRKFILAKVSADPNHKTAIRGKREQIADGEKRVLILIDQHAADERCRVEDLMKNYFAIEKETSSHWNTSTSARNRLVARTIRLDKPLRFDLSRRDGELLLRFRVHFEHWGIFYEIFACAEDVRENSHARKGVVVPKTGSATSSAAQGRQDTVTVEAHALPDSIIERCRLEPRLLVELLRKEIWKLHDDPTRAVRRMRELERSSSGIGSGSGNRGVEEGETDGGWFARFHDCPEGILEMLNSRSCRSAIMFNDPLTVDECKDLVRRLAACDFSFQCAHGRPSMVPLVDLGKDQGFLGGLGLEDGFTTAVGVSDGKEIGDSGRGLWEDLQRWKEDRIRDGS